MLSCACRKQRFDDFAGLHDALLTCKLNHAWGKTHHTQSEHRPYDGLEVRRTFPGVRRTSSPSHQPVAQRRTGSPSYGPVRRPEGNRNADTWKQPQTGASEPTSRLKKLFPIRSAGPNTAPCVGSRHLLNGSARQAEPIGFPGRLPCRTMSISRHGMSRRVAD